MNKVAVIILNWNGEKLLKEFLPSVVENTDRDIADVIVADNGSTDASVAWMREHMPDVKLVLFDVNHGFAEGYNRAIAATGYEYTVLLNSDVSTPPGWIRPLYDFMAGNPKAGACQPKIMSYKEPDTFEYAGAGGGFLDKHGYPYCRGRIFDVCERDMGQYDADMEVFWASGAALMVRTEAYEKAGGLDARFFAHMEEIDLCWRMQLLGYTVNAVAGSKVYHLGGGSLPASNPRKTYLNFRNNLLMMHKNLPDKVRGKRLLVRRLLDTLAWAKFTITGDWANSRAVWRAHRDFAKMRAEYTEHPQKDLLTNPCDILVDYYLKGKKTYSN